MMFEAEDVVKWFLKMSQKTNEQMEFLTALDEEIGDGDHGLNMAQGFRAVHNQLQREAFSSGRSVGQLMKDGAVALMAASSGSAAVLYATAFLKMARVFQDEPAVSAPVFARALKAATEGMKKRGNATSGEKTMIDVWINVTDLFSESRCFPNPDEIERRAYEAMQSTKRMKAKRGKAGFFEQRSIGKLDPGAASSYFLFQSLAETFKEKMNG